MGLPLIYSPISREGIRTITVVRGKGEGGRDRQRRAPRSSRGTKSVEDTSGLGSHSLMVVR